MDFLSRFTILIILSISFLHHHQVVAIDLANACENANNHQLCVQTLEADPSSKQADLSGLAEIAIKSALNAGARISRRIKNLQKTSPGSLDKSPLKDCAEQYSSATEQLKDSLGALPSKRYNDVSTWITAAMTDAMTCEEGFKELPGLTSPLTNKYTNFRQLCSNALGIVNKLSGM